MGRNLKPTGSRLLGAEFRRLRGVRTLDDIVELSRTGPLTRRIRGLCPATISQIENGISMPSLESLYTLSVIYQTSAMHLLNVLVEERLTRSMELPGTLLATRDALHAALGSGRWAEALGLAIHGEHGVEAEADKLLWRANRAVAVAKLGMRYDAVMMLVDCVESADLRASDAWIVHRYIADVAGSAGYFKMASRNAQLALDLAPDDLDAASRAKILEARVRLILQEHDFGAGKDERALREAQVLISQARRAVAPTDSWMPFLLDTYEALSHEFLGNRLLAAKSYGDLAKRAAKEGQARIEMLALMNLGRLRRTEGKLSDAADALLRAERLARNLEQNDEAFEVSFELYLVARQRKSPEQQIYLKRCRRLFPLVQARTPNVRRFEQLQSGGAAR